MVLRLRLFGGHDPANGSRHNLLEYSRVESGRAGKCSESHGSGWVGSGGYQMSRVGSGDPYPTRPDPTRPDPTQPARSNKTREKPWK